MRANQLNTCTIVLAVLFLFSCKKKTEEISTASLSEYMPLQVGKEITYKLDSLVFLDHGTTEEMHYYHEKHVVDAEIPDALGRPSFRVFRYLRDTSGTGPWSPAGTYLITPANKTIEIIENNQRVIKLKLPIVQDFSWKGNLFLADEPFDPYYEFENDYDMEDWDYYYASLGETLELNGQTIPDVLTVNGIDRSDNVPVINTFGYGSIDYIQDKYAKGIGLIYQRFIMWEYQPPNISNPNGSKTGFALTRSMIDHN